MANLGTTVDEAVGLSATYVSNSYGGGESSSAAASQPRPLRRVR
ncbi:hypothetical protein [Streptomyces violarus]|uniref:Uncharacterized protein n=1 Tax=Streptomyces violarus TaxID=67380 RepID=A0A7W5F637_9ACTN|nr:MULTISPECIES: hypothetical protein [Streptomyces]MBB3081139.1 hypothetical protein [Streptomyces violarus]WRU00248.1 hypothetical protein VJ737_22350 [Streptomyces sp. CGMCC 4.1772]